MGSGTSNLNEEAPRSPPNVEAAPPVRRTEAPPLWRTEAPLRRTEALPLQRAEAPPRWRTEVPAPPLQRAEAPSLLRTEAPPAPPVRRTEAPPLQRTEVPLRRTEAPAPVSPLRRNEARRTEAPPFRRTEAHPLRKTGAPAPPLQRTEALPLRRNEAPSIPRAEAPVRRTEAPSSSNIDASFPGRQPRPSPPIIEDAPPAPKEAAASPAPNLAAAGPAPPVRATRLKQYFDSVVSGKRKVTSSSEALNFLLALRNHDSPVDCVKNLVASPAGLDAVRTCVRVDLSTPFILDAILPFLLYVSEPAVKTAAHGQPLRLVLQAVAQPPTMWNALLSACEARQIPADRMLPFGWLVHELVSLPPKATTVDYSTIMPGVRALVDTGAFLADNLPQDVQDLGPKIKKGFQLLCAARERGGLGTAVNTKGPGGRHDNDLDDFQDIRIYPTRDEYLCQEPSFYRTLDDVFATPLPHRQRVHLDNQFRLLRESMLTEFREEFQAIVGDAEAAKEKEKKKGGGWKKKGAPVSKAMPPASKGMVLSGVTVFDLVFEISESKRPPRKCCCLAIQCKRGLERLSNMADKIADPKIREEYLRKDPGFLKHQAAGVLHRGQDIIGFASIDRNVEMLMATPPVVLLQFADHRDLCDAIEGLLSEPATSNGNGNGAGCEAQFTLLKTAFFAYEPILRGLQGIGRLPLHDELLDPTPSGGGEEVISMTSGLRNYLASLQSASGANAEGQQTKLPGYMGKDGCELDASQVVALTAALRSPVSQIQGPPGTGKSMIGAQVVRMLHEHTPWRILVVSFKNHALDQFLLDAVGAGIPRGDMVRIGNKARTDPEVVDLLMSEQRRSYSVNRESWSELNRLKVEAGDISEMVGKSFSQTRQTLSPSARKILEHLEFASDEEDLVFFDAFEIPEMHAGDTNGGSGGGGWRAAGRGGREMGPSYLFDRWVRGQDAGVFKNSLPATTNAVWAMPPDKRRQCVECWKRAIADDQLSTLSGLARQLDSVLEQIQARRAASDVAVLEQKRVIGATTSGAAKYARAIQAARPDVVVVEEAGEILESHILTAIGPSVKQLIMIGDHKQLRPTVQDFKLTVERGGGFDLNRSLFERMIMQQGAPHATLQTQHRMVPEIAVFPRELTYPKLLDGPGTRGRPPMLGVRDRVVFLSHGQREDSDGRVARDPRDPATRGSKMNRFEAEMAIRCIKYFGQQGYPSDKITVLAPYLGQVQLLRDLLTDNKYDPEISELDKAELTRAGLMVQASARPNGDSVRVSSVDNFQGDQNDIIIACLTRSNEQGDIGFMSSPERLNVLVTRARNCLVMIGNTETFKRSKKGRQTWKPFFELVEQHDHLYDGLPIRCEKHPDRTAELKTPNDFEEFCPDGGCTEPCNTPLSCGVHKCPLRCHMLTDHSGVECTQLVSKTCERKHATKVPCPRRADRCRTCKQEDEAVERRARRDLELEKKRLRREAEYARKLQEIDDEADSLKRQMRYETEETQRNKDLEQRRGSLAELRKRRENQDKMKQVEAEREKQRKQQQGDGSTSGAVPQRGPAQAPPPDSAAAEWQHLKATEGAVCEPLDKLMGMVGLEEVKHKFLNIKSKVDTTVQQGSSLMSERFGCSLLGNPGTGKTTVARLYAAFLADCGVIPGSIFKEETGSGLASMGVPGCKKLLEEVLDGGGGVVFIDETYQLTSGNNPGGAAVLDYLLPEIENLTGKVVFVLAGYSRPMESFFGHNVGLPSRFPEEMHFADYTDPELLDILELKLAGKYQGRMRYEAAGGEEEGGPRGLYCRIVARRIGRGRGREGFGNARAVENAIAGVTSRLAQRFRTERKAGLKPDVNLLTKEDLIGPEPGEALAGCEAWKELQAMIGLGAVKEAVKALVDSIQTNYARELAEKPLIEYSLNKVFLGNPGTGKTTVAKQYGAILVAMGLLSKGEVVAKNPSDFVGAHLGQSEQQTKGILAATAGKVLVIDEAYGLDGGGGGGQGGTSDPYKTAVIDTIVAEVQSVPGDDRCVLLLGYKDPMETMFQRVNPGLSRRFPLADAFVFEDFSADELQDIFTAKLARSGFRATPEARRVVGDMLARARNRANFGNAGEIDNLMNTAKARHQRRLSSMRRRPTAAGAAATAVAATKKTANKKKAKAKAEDEGEDPDLDLDLFEPADFDENFDRGTRSETNVAMLFRDSVGAEETVARLQGYQETARNMKRLDLDARENIPFNFLFRGPPGTGKTTTARKMGKVFCDMGFLSTAEVVECSATDLVGQFVGQTGPKVQTQLTKALGRVLFVDEAYRLAEGPYAREAMDEMVDCLTKERFHKKLIVILAGYEHDINRLMAGNPGLTSRFPEVVNFRALTPGECIELLGRTMQDYADMLQKGGRELDRSCLDEAAAAAAAAAPSSPPSSPGSPGSKLSSGTLRAFLLDHFARLAKQDSWASARDVKTIAKTIFNKAIQSKADIAQGRLVIREQVVRNEVMAVLAERAARASAARSSKPATISDLLGQQLSQQDAPAPPQTSVATSSSAAAATKIETHEEERPAPVVDTEEVVCNRENNDKDDGGGHGGAAEDARRDVGVSDAVWEQLQRDRQAAEAREAEYQRLAEEVKRPAATDAARDAIVKRLLEEEKRRAEEQAIKEKLAAMGCCPVGYEWTKQDGGWRCAGGAHWMPDGVLGV